MSPISSNRTLASPPQRCPWSSVRGYFIILDSWDSNILEASFKTCHSRCPPPIVPEKEPSERTIILASFFPGEEPVISITVASTKDEPFFLYLSYYTPHVPIEGKPGYVEYFQRKINQELIHRNPGYAAMIASLDENIGRVLNKIEELGISDNTVIVFYSDNGGLATARVNTNNNYPLRSGKGSLYEGGIRVPLIIKWPGHTDPGSICNYPVNSMDFYPTFLEIANIAGDEKQNMNFDGKSLVPLLNDSETSLDRKSLFWHYPHYYMGITTPVSAIRKGKWKLLHYYENNRLELYNLEKDVSEEHDLANEYPGLAEELYILLKNNLKEVNAKHPSYNSNYIQVQ